MHSHSSASMLAKVIFVVIKVFTAIFVNSAFSMLMRMHGHEVHCAHDGLAALKLAAAVRPELILLDIGMPGMDGCEVARRLRADGELSEAWLVAVTGYGQEDDRARSRAAGFDEHFVKPLTSRTLREILGRVPSRES